MKNRIIYTTTEFTKAASYIISDLSKLKLYQAFGLDALHRSFPKNETYKEYQEKKFKKFKEKTEKFEFREFESTLKKKDIRVIVFIEDKIFLFKEKLPDSFCEEYAKAL